MAGLIDIHDHTPRGQIEFRYCLGDLCLFRIRFQGCIARQTFDPAAAPLTRPFENPEIPKDVDLVLYGGRHITERLPTIQPTRRAICYIRNQTVNYYIDLAGSFDDYLKGFSSKTRSTLQRKLRKITAMAGGTLECRTFRTLDDVKEFHRYSRQIAVKTYQERMFDGAIPASVEFAERMRRLAQRNCLRAFVLLIKGEPVSYLYLPASDGALVYGYLGYDPTYARWSPGTILLYLALERVFAEQQFRYFNFTHGEGQAKELFGRARFLQADVHFFHWTLRNALAVYGHAGVEWLSSKIGQLLETVGLRKMMRKLLRHWFGSEAKAA